MNDPFDPFSAEADFDPFAEGQAEAFDPFAEERGETAPPAKAAPAPSPAPVSAAVPERLGTPSPLRAAQGHFPTMPSEPVKKVRSVFAETGDCAVCGQPGGSHGAAGAPFLHQVCGITAARALASSAPADVDFVRRCDAAGSRRRALEGDGVAPGLLFYVPSSFTAEAR